MLWQEKYSKVVFSTPYLCLCIILLARLCCQFCKQFSIKHFKKKKIAVRRKGKNEKFKGKHKCGNFKNHLQKEEVDWQSGASKPRRIIEDINLFGGMTLPESWCIGIISWQKLSQNLFIRPLKALSIIMYLQYICIFSYHFSFGVIWNFSSKRTLSLFIHYSCNSSDSHKIVLSRIFITSLADPDSEKERIGLEIILSQAVSFYKSYLIYWKSTPCLLLVLKDVSTSQQLNQSTLVNDTALSFPQRIINLGN